MKTIAITGGIGSGKSLAGKFLLEMGYVVIDTDDISKQLYEKGQEGFDKTVELFGKGILNGEGGIDRKKLGEIVFDNKKQLEALNELMHPLIQKRLEQILEGYRDREFVFVLVPLLFEVGWQNRFDKVWLVLSDEKIRIARAMERDGLSGVQIKKRIKNQIKHKNFSTLAHNVLYNNSSRDEFRVQVNAALKTL